MRPLPAVGVILLMVVSVAAPVTGFASPAQTADGSDQLPQITVVDNTTNHLTIPASDVRSTTYNQSSIDVGVAVAAGSSDLRSDYATTTFERKFFQQDSEAARDRLVDETLTNIESKRTSLEQRNQIAIQQYANGAITAREFLRQRALLDAESRQLATRLDRIRATAGTAPDYSLSPNQRFRLENNRGVLKTSRGPISQRISAETAGNTEPNTVYVEVSSEGYMLSTVAGGRYTRETYLGQDREQTAIDQFARTNDSLRAVNTRAETLYPWLYSEQYPSVQTYGRSAIYQIQADHSNGQLTAYLDGGTTNVFYETQHLELTTVDRSEVATNVNQSVRVRVEQSFESGPLLVTVSDNSTGSTADSTVRINGKRIGTTGTDGSLWTVEPRGEYTVTVTTQDGDRVRVPVSGSA
ncbi:hypothetical protein SG26_09965 [Haloarcula sp. CBA1115]|uniref:DUF7096 domain-containing protein n=1 Tax=unclassified Haloarcula TaxID=2624677 RepID=UPI00059558F5|nr:MULTISPECIES: hypothetical protein [unclassified Haloarcula]AJF26026.1 hypothetical protein SG26_09965 [Haloarcula sp. CBA1115]KAA9405334.1 hypothetical protein Har1131_00315 [Haloarcula sp. CBA1131]